jgi:hypothetical protein
MISSRVFITKGPCATTGSSKGSAWPNSTTLSSAAVIATASPSCASVARWKAGTRRPPISNAPRTT